ncbi:MAG: FkbM family methyltransferase [Nitrospinota bacterium]|nr:FkbM family methyltransferase [Nitrospinota bacterium]MDH5587780.1 FkbM family methyltransferase [Nitrospirota bacterium]
MKNPLKRYLKDYQKYMSRLISNKQSRFLRPLYLRYELFLKRHGNTYYSGFGEDIVLKKIFHRKGNGVYVDVGCWHPKWGSNTYLLHKKGWEGLNIDMDDFKIAMFNIARKNATNICTAVSDKEQDVMYYCSTNDSSLNTLEENFADAMAQNKPKLKYDLKQIHSKPLDKILAETSFAEKEIDLLTIDVEGHELPVLQSLNFEKYKPKVVVVELHEEKIESILDHVIYQFIQSKNYSLFSWVLPSLIFVRDGYLTESVVVPFPQATTPMTPTKPH